MDRTVAGAGFLLGILILIAGTSAVDITGCGEISTPGTYELKNDILGVQDESCIQITSSDVIVHGNGHTISGALPQRSEGILIRGSGPVFRITLENLILLQWKYPIRGEKVRECRITGCSIGTGMFGVSLEDVQGCRIDMNTVTGQANYGIRIDPSSQGNICSGNTIADNTLRMNPGTGITVGGRNNVLSGNIAMNNGVGVDAWGIGHRIERNRLEENTRGIYGFGLKDAIISENMIRGNGYGIYFDDQSVGNEIRRNIISEHGSYGIFLQKSSGNTIHDNFFDNVNNIRLVEDHPNSWNTPKTRGINIVNGPYLGGNYWGLPDGTGFSQVCTDAKPVDGICDFRYRHSDGNVDDFPLTNLTGRISDVFPATDTYANAGPGYDLILGKRVPVRDINYGSSPGLVVQRGQRCMPGFSFWEAALLQFDLSRISPGVGIKKATLKLTQSTLNPERVSAHRMLLAWSEREATFNRPRMAGSPWGGGWEGGVNFAAAPTDTVPVPGEVGKTVSWDVTRDVQAFVDGVPNHGWILRSAETSGQSDYSRTAFHSRESTGVVYIGPVLEIEFGNSGGGAG